MHACQVLVETPSRNYTAWDYDQLLADLGLQTSRLIYQKVQLITLGNLTAPGVSEVRIGKCEREPCG
jgi:hypothetical protein